MSDYQYVQFVLPKLGKRGRKVRFKWNCVSCGHVNRWKWLAHEWVEGPAHMKCEFCKVKTVVELLPIEEE